MRDTYGIEELRYLIELHPMLAFIGLHPMLAYIALSGPKKIPAKKVLFKPRKINSFNHR
jgi:hypothetical protein